MTDESPRRMMGADSPETPNKNQLNAIKLSLAEVKMSGNNNIQPTDVLNFNGTFDFGDLDDFESAPGEGASILNKLNESKEPQEANQMEEVEEPKEAEKKVVFY